MAPLPVRSCPARAVRTPDHRQQRGQE
jgi:hypothetical protein